MLWNAMWTNWGVAAACFGRAIANGDSTEADEAAAELINAPATTNPEDAFVEAHLWPTPSCGGQRNVEGEPRLFEERWSYEECLLSIKWREVERERRIETLHGAEVVRLAREAQRAPAAEEKYKRADRSLNQGEEVNDTD